MKFYKLTQTKQVFNEKWVQKYGRCQKLKSIMLSSETTDFKLFANQNTAENMKMKLTRTHGTPMRKNKKTECIGTATWGIDEVVYNTWNIDEIEIDKKNITQTQEGKLKVFDGTKSFIVDVEKILEK